MGASMDLSEEQLQFAFKLPPQGTCVVRFGYFPRPFLLDVPLFEGKKEVSDEFVEERMKDFYRDITPKQQTIEVVTPSKATTPQMIPEEARTLLEHIAKNPFDNFTTHREKCTIGEHRVDKARGWLEENGYISSEMIKIKKGRSRPSCFLVLQEKAINHLSIKQHFGKGSFKHQVYCQLIKKKLGLEGWTAEIESLVNLSKKLIDVVAKKDTETVGYEVTLHFENLQENIEKDFEIINRLIIVVEKKDIGKAKELIQERKAALNPDKHIEIKSIDEYFE